MTNDQHDPSTQTSGSADGASTTAANGATENATTKSGKAPSSRTPRRRHTSSRTRQTKESQAKAKEAKEVKDQQGEQPATAAPEALAAPTAAELTHAQESPATELAAQVASAVPATTAPAQAGGESAPRPSTRGRRGGASRRRGKTEKTEPDVQLVPVVSANEPGAEPEPVTATEPKPAPEGQPELAPVAEVLPLDAAILAHLDALSAAERLTTEGNEGGQAEQAEQAEQTRPSAEAEIPVVEAQPEEAPRSRYRFGRPRSPVAPATTASRAERLSGWRATPPTLMGPLPAEAPQSSAARNEVAAVAAEPAESAETPETPEMTEAPATSVTVLPMESSTEAAGAETPVGEETADEHHEEQVEHEGASHRRRRRGRGRNGRAQEAETGETEGEEHERQEEPQGHAETPARPTTPYAAPNGTVTYAHEYENNGYMTGMEGYDESTYSPYTPTPRQRASRPSAPASPARRQESAWDMSTAQQHVQEPASPFGSPEPSFARGFGPQSAGVAGPLHENQTRVRRGERGGEAPPMSANQLGTVMTNAIAQQTDRLLSELRRQQYPPSMTVALPAFPSTERIGVFVDVANLLYSARSQRMSIDFGRLLDFLRANRRLIRAHAYAPTNPDPHAEQTFLAAVKGVGYRITTKNYKTFASGARKADMDLDLCMDIVRLVDAGALDTVVLVSGDSDFLPLLEYCSDHGVRVEVAAFDDAAAMILRQSCDLFINLSQVDEIRA